MAKFVYKPQGICPRQMDFEIEDGRLHNLQVLGGCSGNLQGLAKLTEGMAVEEIISRLEGISCGGKPSSCPDQLAKALKQAQAQIKA